MKLSLLASTTLLSSAAAFAPVGHTSKSSPALYAISGEEARAAHGSFAPGHFETHGSRGSAGRVSCDGEEVRAARASYAKPGYGEIGYDGLPRKEYMLPSDYHTSFAPGQFETQGSQSAAGRAVCDGEEVRAARPSYAKPGYGEIGSDGSERRLPIPTAGYSTSFAPGEIATHSSTGAGGYSPAAPVPQAPAAAAAALPAKSYALGGGGWKTSGASSNL